MQHLGNKSTLVSDSNITNGKWNKEFAKRHKKEIEHAERARKRNKKKRESKYKKY